MFQATDIPSIGCQSRNPIDLQGSSKAFADPRAIFSTASTRAHCPAVIYIAPCLRSRAPMPSTEASISYCRKRRLTEEESKTDISPPPTAKRQKLEDHQRHRTPSSFWDNLSRQWLTPRALREFDRRTVWPASPVPPHDTGKENISPAKLKRFARHGGPSLGNIRAVSTILLLCE